jgi:histidine ammonia-lyase
MISIPSSRLRLEDVEAVAAGARVRLSAQGHRRIGRARQALQEIIAQGRPAYGINTGFGALADRAIPSQDLTQLQHNLILSHAVGAGDPLDVPDVRAVMFLRANMLSKGYSGVRCKLVEQLIGLLNRGIVPVVPRYGSVGASGDLAPLAHIALAVIGRGDVCYQGGRTSAARALKSAGLTPYELCPKEGLSLINGTEVMAGTGAMTVLRSERLADLADLAGAMTCASLGCDPRVFDLTVHALKPHPGQRHTAKQVRSYLCQEMGTLPVFVPKTGGVPVFLGTDRIQDAYSLRCIPQVHGAAREGIAFARRIVETEINSVTDNPVILAGSPVSHGNFHGSAIALALDSLAIALTQLALISERRTFRLLDPKLSGLPAFLVPNPGTNSGFMVVQLLAASLLTQCKLLSAPASVHSLPTSAGQEDFVSMGMNSSLKAREVSEHVETILAAELLCAAQALELSGRAVPVGLKRAFRRIRSVVPFLSRDREIHQDITRLKQILGKLPG